jgi:hypothetical protein
LKSKSMPHVRPVGISGIPRADKEIWRTIETLRQAQFEQDPLFDAGDSFRISLCNSAVKREGAILEAAIKDAIEQTSHLSLLGSDVQLPRQIDVQFEIRNNGWLVALEVKRGSMHDSTKLRQFRTDLEDIPPLLKTALPLFPTKNVIFHILFISGEPPLKEGLTLKDLERLYGLYANSHVLTARQRYSAAIKTVLRERGL